MIEVIHYFRVPVIDLDVSVQWYTECLGFTLLRNAGDLAVLELKAGPLLVLFKFCIYPITF
ncbi:VOC family protein [Paenibacillus allorhizosphaerae]|uniref:VOC family protein n=1 Tax=Paenibacillus allorhizosphaerae TaxID=2849866 RepID=UPI001C4068F0